MAWHVVARSTEVLEGKAMVAHAQGKALALVRVGGKVYAVNNQCPHRDGELGLGTLVDHYLYCPLHAWSYDVRSGNAFFPQGSRIACFEVREENGDVSVSVP